MVEFIYNYGDIIQFIVYIINALAVAAAAIAITVVACKHGKCCKGGHGHMHHGHHGHGECCEPKADAADVSVEKFVD